MRARLNYSHRKPEQPAQHRITEQDVWLTVYAAAANARASGDSAKSDTWADRAVENWRERYGSGGTA